MYSCEPYNACLDVGGCVITELEESRELKGLVIAPKVSWFGEKYRVQSIRFALIAASEEHAVKWTEFVDILGNFSAFTKAIREGHCAP